MRGVSALVALAACWCAAEATLVCSNTTFCEVVKCEWEDAGRCAGEVRPNATVCGCCPACIEIYDVGAYCPEYNGRRRQGTRYTWECSPGSLCINNQCTKIETTTATLETVV
ncbi:hypothetical protein R5R35_002702 [Gryllus longicercus]|uniref:Uncharacterized protein n=1 Tax=Gryllus longicercus TaxID=2509291 RepID=A0AAN9ZGH7_9ORTH